MKKLSVLISVCIFSLTSCKKDYTCNCTMTDSMDGSVTYNSQIINGKRKGVEEACNRVTVVETVTFDCKVQ